VSVRSRVPSRLKRWTLDALYGALTIVLAPYALARVLRDRKTRSRWRAYARDLTTRFGPRRRRTGAAPCVWIHGVSVGEVKAAANLVKRLEEGWPGAEIVISVTTDTGRRVALELYPGQRVEFYPPDLSWVVLDAFEAVRPDAIVLMESEFWPNFLLAAQDRQVPVALVNGKLSAGSAARFALARGLTRPLLGSLALVCVQAPEFAERFRGLGVPSDRVFVTGNMKLDNIPIRREGSWADGLRRLLALPEGRPVLVAGSTHPGEEQALARIVRRLAAAGQPMTLVVAPRHPGRAEAVARDIRAEGLTVALRSRATPESPPPPEAVRVLDTVGELEQAYALADAVFVGGTLVPHGGQNMMEPASQGRAVVVGPYVHNFRSEVEMLSGAGGLALAADEADVEATLARWLADPETARLQGERARSVLEINKGATERTLEVLRPLLDAALRRAARPAGER
jgi:3-deoxy-D-manno-octulosonic-acid transferase